MTSAAAVDGQDAEAFAAWYADHWGPAHRLATHLLGDRVEAEDVASEALLRVWTRWQGAGVPDHPDAYLRQAVANHVASRFRRRARERAVMDVSLPVFDRGPETSVVDRAEVAWLLGQLAPPERDAVVAYYLDDRPCADIARTSGVVAASVRSRLHRGRRHLSAVLAG